MRAILVGITSLSLFACGQDAALEDVSVQWTPGETAVEPLTCTGNEVVIASSSARGDFGGLRIAEDARSSRKRVDPCNLTVWSSFQRADGFWGMTVLDLHGGLDQYTPGESRTFNLFDHQDHAPGAMSARLIGCSLNEASADEPTYGEWSWDVPASSVDIEVFERAPEVLEIAYRATFLSWNAIDIIDGSIVVKR